MEAEALRYERMALTALARREMCDEDFRTLFDGKTDTFLFWMRLNALVLRKYVSAKRDKSGKYIFRITTAGHKYLSEL